MIFRLLLTLNWGFPGDSVVKNLPAMQETRVQSLGQEDSLEKEMSTQSSILAWEIPRTEKPGGIQFMGWAKRQDLEQHGISSTFIEKDYPFPNMLYCYAVISW